MIRYITAVASTISLCLSYSACKESESEFGSTQQAISACLPPVHEIACENEQAGTPISTWDVNHSESSILGFSTDISVNRGETIHFKIDTPSTAYHIDIYRVGFYNGNGARLIQAGILPTAYGSQPACSTDGGSVPNKLVDCGNWTERASWAVPATATSGVYLARLVRDDGDFVGRASHIPFVVRNDTSNSDILFQTSDTTWQAYNSYGNVGLYGGTSTDFVHRVSYNRPFVDRAVGTIYGNKASYFFAAEYPMIRFLEANGFDVSYAAAVDTDRAGTSGTATALTTTTLTDASATWSTNRFVGATVAMGGKRATVTSNTATMLTFTGGWSGGGVPTLGAYNTSALRSHKAFLSVGHDEYWSGRQRANVEYALSQGVNLAFLSGNEMTWKTHLDPSIDGTNTPFRTLVTYKESYSSSGTPAGDYSYDTDGFTIRSGGRVPDKTTVTAATGTPIQITTSAAHGLTTGQPIIITGVGGNTNANGSWLVTVISSTKFSLVGSASNAAYTGGGFASAPWTGQWGDPTGSNSNYGALSDGSKPENGLTGTKWVVEIDERGLKVPWYYGDHRLWRNTGIGHGLVAPIGMVCQCGGSPCGCVIGHEWDSDVDNGFRPAGLMRTSSTSVGAAPDPEMHYFVVDYGPQYIEGHPSTHHTTMYRSPATSTGALVFGAGTINWTWGLDGCHDHDPTFTETPSNMSAICADPNELIGTDQAMRQATVNLFADMCNSSGQCIQPRTLRSGLSLATKSTDATAPTSSASVSPSPTLGTPSTVTVTATDGGGGVVGGVDVSVDGGVTWHPADISLRNYSSCTSGLTCSTWTYTWMPTALGAFTVKSRAVDDTGNLETPGAGLGVTVSPRASELLYFYKASTGAVACGKLSSAGTYTNLGTATIQPDWTHIVSVKGVPMAPVGGVSPGYVNAFLFYSSSTGFAWTARLDDSCIYSELAPNTGPHGVPHSPGPGWNIVVPGSNNMVLFYDSAGHRMMLGRLDELGFFAPLSAATVAGTYTHVVAAGNNVFLFYNSSTGAAATTKINAPSNNYVTLNTISTLSPGWTHIVAGVNNVLLFFKSTPGNAMSAQLDGAGNLNILQNPLWNADLAWSSIVAGFKNKTLFFYHSPSGTFATGTLDQNGNYVSFGSGSGFSTGWTHIVGP